MVTPSSLKGLLSQPIYRVRDTTKLSEIGVKILNTASGAPLIDLAAGMPTFGRANGTVLMADRTR